MSTDPRLGLGLGHQDHPLLGRQVRDTASGTVGKLMAVVVEEVPTHRGPRRVRLAYLRRDGGGRELATAVGNIERFDGVPGEPGKRTA
ncbi:hypothetical protein [Streptomyces sp. H27-H5]|uniref:hypothetical protein n=1 Tax=Streptomyces sp. H27-H5 TaxID=2996460 RepID=UPI00226E7126|nr:hypothetical protein [Streptomyces sp. H27-H5]MCY0924202.1 hypothetical protein [Streptomyces sp. H27-G5]MCY0962875.1 hypothetical protein [Streptomyces sp. H27-H5]